MTVLTMIFNQSSISWRIGEATVADLDDVSDGIATIHHEADNLYVWGSDSHALLSPWDASGNLRRRAVDVSGAGTVSDGEKINKLNNKVTDSTKPGQWGSEGVGSGDGGHSADTYTVNVMSAGPDRRFDTWDDIWSYPDDFD